MAEEVSATMQGTVLLFLGLALAEQHWDALPLKKETVTPTLHPPKLGTVVGLRCVPEHS